MYSVIVFNLKDFLHAPRVIKRPNGFVIVMINSYKTGIFKSFAQRVFFFVK